MCSKKRSLLFLLEMACCQKLLEGEMGKAVDTILAFQKEAAHMLYCLQESFGRDRCTDPRQ